MTGEILSTIGTLVSIASLVLTIIDRSHKPDPETVDAQRAPAAVYAARITLTAIVALNLAAVTGAQIFATQGSAKPADFSQGAFAIYVAAVILLHSVVVWVLSRSLGRGSRTARAFTWIFCAYGLAASFFIALTPAALNRAEVQAGYPSWAVVTSLALGVVSIIGFVSVAIMLSRSASRSFFRAAA